MLPVRTFARATVLVSAKCEHLWYELGNFILLQGQNVIHQLVHVEASGPSLGDSLGCSALELLCSLPHLMSLLALHHLLDGLRHLASLELAVQHDASTPHLLDVPRVAHLVAEVRPTQHRHAPAHALEG